MSDWLASGAIVDVIVAMVVLEAVVLIALRRRIGRGPAAVALLANLAAGGLLLLALRAALHGEGPGLIGSCLAVALAAHIADIWMRWRQAG